MWPYRTTDQKEESIRKLSQYQIADIDVSSDWLDIYCLPDGARLRWPNNEDGHTQITAFATARHALVYFDATGGQEWHLWSSLDTAGIATRQLPPAQIRAFAANRGIQAKTDGIDAEITARFMMFRPDAGRVFPHEKLRRFRALSSKPGQLVEARKRASDADQGA